MTEWIVLLLSPRFWGGVALGAVIAGGGGWLAGHRAGAQAVRVHVLTAEIARRQAAEKAAAKAEAEAIRLELELAADSEKHDADVRAATAGLDTSSLAACTITPAMIRARNVARGKGGTP